MNKRTLIKHLSLIIGSDLLVDSVKELARQFGISDRIISLTVVTIGTSLPELITSIIASHKGESDIILGNILGSNIFNICVVLGIPVAIFGTITPSSFTIVDLVALVGSAFILFLFALTKKKINRFEGFLMFVSFLAYYLLLIIF